MMMTMKIGESQWRLGPCKLYYLLLLVFRTSLRGARRPLAREPDEEYLKAEIIETNFSIDFSAISE